MRRAFIALRFTVSYVGTAALAELSQELETLARNSELEGMPQKVEELQRLFERTRDQLLGRTCTP